MNKFIFIFNSSFDIYISAKNGGSHDNIELFEFYLTILKPKSDFKKPKLLYKIDNQHLTALKSELDKALSLYLKEREDHPPASEQTEWRGRFLEEQMFNKKNIYGRNYKLFSGGIDNKIFWSASFIELINHSIKNELNLYIYFNEKVVDIRRYQRILARLERSNI